MPKIPRYELERHLDPESEEYAPPMGEIKDEREIQAEIMEEIVYIQDMIDGVDSFTGKRSKHSETSPEQLWHHLAYVRMDLAKIKDSELRKKPGKEIKEVEEKVYKGFIPFIAGLIYGFGRERSPLEKHGSRAPKIDPRDIQDNFAQARSVLEHSNVPQEEQIAFLSELASLQERFGLRSEEH